MFASNLSGGTISIVETGSLIPLPDQDLDGFSSNVGNTIFTVPASGRYYITYDINLMTSIELISKVLVNGAAIPASIRRPFIEISYGASFIAMLQAGDQVSLELSGATGTLPLERGLGAGLTIIRLS